MLPNTTKRRIEDWVKGELAKGNREKIIEKLNVIVDNFYNHSPSGDYGRGDVREEIEYHLQEGVC